MFKKSFIKKFLYGRFRVFRGVVLFLSGYARSYIVACKKSRRNWYLRNKDTDECKRIARECKQRYNAKNVEKNRQYCRDYYIKNREEKTRKHREWCRLHRDEICAKMREQRRLKREGICANI